MVVTATLTEVGFAQLTETFNLAFSDYDIPISMTVDQLALSLATVGYRAEDSIGLFDGDELAGFIFIGRDGTLAYDAGTGIIPAYRGKGYAHLMLEAAITLLQERGCSAFYLEVLESNSRAQRLYERHGFVQERLLSCFYGKREEVEAQPTQLIVGQPSTEPFEQINPFRPSWQNSNRSINRGECTIAPLMDARGPVGVAAFNTPAGSIAQIIIDERKRTTSILKEAIIACARASASSQMRMINVDSNDHLLIEALTEAGFQLFATQSEMVRYLGR